MQSNNKLGFKRDTRKCVKPEDRKVMYANKLTFMGR